MNDLNHAGKRAEGGSASSDVFTRGAKWDAVKRVPTGCGSAGCFALPKVMKQMKRVLIGVLGGTVLLIGVAMVVLPGPAILVVPAGLTILAIEFAWAKRWLQASREFMPRRLKDLKWESVRGRSGSL